MKERSLRFAWSGNLYECLCLCFGLGPAPRIFSKPFKVPIALLRQLNIRLVIYLDDILLMGRTEEVLMSQDTLIFLLQHLGFVIKLKKSVLKPSQQIDVLGLKIDTHTMTLALTEENMKYQNLLSHFQTTVLELTKLISLMSSTVQAVLPARLQLRYLQQQQIQSLNQACSYQVEIILNSPSKQELLWWVKILRLNNGRSLRRKKIISDTKGCIKIRLGGLLGCQLGGNGQKSRRTYI